MKKYILTILIAVVMSSVFAGGRFYVKVKPVHPNVEVNIGPCPSPKHLWVDGYWAWHPGPGPGHYEWVDGCWKVPPGKYKHWVPGHWKNTPYGWYWVDGQWKK